MSDLNSEKDTNAKKGLAIASFILGILSVIAWLIPFFGLPISIVGLVTGIKGRKSSNVTLASIGLVLSATFLAICCIYTAAGIYYVYHH